MELNDDSSKLIIPNVVSTDVCSQRKWDSSCH
jgi:hypothetical protein